MSHIFLTKYVIFWICLVKHAENSVNILTISFRMQLKTSLLFAPNNEFSMNFGGFLFCFIRILQIAFLYFLYINIASRGSKYTTQNTSVGCKIEQSATPWLWSTSRKLYPLPWDPHSVNTRFEWCCWNISSPPRKEIIL